MAICRYREQEEVKAYELHVTDIRTEEEKAMEAELAKEMLKVRAPRRAHLEPAAACRGESRWGAERAGAGRQTCRRRGRRRSLLRRRPSSTPSSLSWSPHAADPVCASPRVCALPAPALVRGGCSVGGLQIYTLAPLQGADGRQMFSPEEGIGLMEGEA